MKLSCLSFTVVMSAVLLSPLALAQVAPSEMRVIKLQHAAAAELGSIVQQGFGSRASIVADERTNSLVVSTDGGTLGRIEELIRMLDVAVDASAASTSDVARVFPIQHAVADDGLAGMLNNVFGGNPRQGQPMRIAADPSTNQIVAQGSNQELEALAHVIEALDREPEAGQGPAGLSVRLLWLVRGLDMPQARPLPADMKPVLAELERIGVTDLRLASQTAVRASVGQSFSASFITSLGEPWRVLFNGVASSASSGQRKLEIMLSARPPEGEVLSLLQTTITTPPGKYVVLCVSPIENLDSAFVIQVMDVE